ncbi:MAG: hypothetical protein JO132_16720 [Streptosporangiaceae bacterium]|nr:hypothetical protein [Streptosporangiaceae bacterium]
MTVTVVVGMGVGVIESDGVGVGVLPAVVEYDVCVPGAGVGDDVQPATAADPAIASAPQPTAVRRALSAVPAMAARTFIVNLRHG